MSPFETLFAWPFLPLVRLLALVGFGTWLFRGPTGQGWGGGDGDGGDGSGAGDGGGGGGE